MPLDSRKALNLVGSDTSPELLVNGPQNGRWTIALAHGAGAGMATPFMNVLAVGLAERGYRVARFEFPYMADRSSGKRRPPDRETVLRDTWLKVIDKLGRRQLVIGGKSMGGRIASLVADEAAVAGLVCLGYPFHPVGKPTQLRTQHLEFIKTPTLILQGQRDPFGGPAEVAGYHLPSTIRLHWLVDGDHSFKPRKSSGTTEAQNLETAITEIDSFVRDLRSDKRPRDS
ncbi:MAG TPA: alpha/beta fold hydrolase [Planctomycetaceae bacterium]|nr:alpha/beta fold hydrolase [Planctomycetaceae bacterium]